MCGNNTIIEDCSNRGRKFEHKYKVYAHHLKPFERNYSITLLSINTTFYVLKPELYNVQDVFMPNISGCSQWNGFGKYHVDLRVSRLEIHVHAFIKIYRSIFINARSLI